MYRATNVPTDDRDRPLQPVKIVESGSLQMPGEPFVVQKRGAVL